MPFPGRRAGPGCPGRPDQLRRGRHRRDSSCHRRRRPEARTASTQSSSWSFAYVLCLISEVKRSLDGGGSLRTASAGAVEETLEVDLGLAGYPTLGSGRGRGRDRNNGQVLGAVPSAKLIAEEAKWSRGCHGESRLGCKGARVQAVHARGASPKWQKCPPKCC